MPIRLVEKTSSSARHTPLATSLTPHERLRQGPVEDHVEFVAYDAVRSHSYRVWAKSFAHLAEAEPETLAYHLTEAGLLEKAVGYWLRAGKIAVARFANIEAIAHLRRGIEALGGVPTAQPRTGSSSTSSSRWDPA